MTINQRASDAIDPNDPVFQYLTGAPLPRRSIARNDIDRALAQLEEAARLATVPDAAGKRWVPGLSIVVVGGEGNNNYSVRYCAGHGAKSVESNASVGPDTLFPCASLSKPVSTTLLAAAGVGVEPQWEKPVNQPLGKIGPPYHLAKSSAQETLRQWLSHRSGMPDHGGDLIEDLNPAMLRHDLFGRIMKYQIGIKPGEFRYTNFGFTMGCYGAMIALGPTNWEAFAADALSKLGMSRSTYTFTSAFADGHADRVLPHQGKPEPSDLLSLQPTGWTWHVVGRAQERNPTRQAPAGSLLSSASDLGRFLEAHLRPPRFGDFPPRNPKSDEARGPSHWYSLGWNVTNRGDEDAFKGMWNAISFSHSGAFALGAGTCLRFDPDAGFGVAILSNGEPTGVPEALVQLFFKYLYGQPMPAGCDHARLLALSRMLTMREMYKQKIANDERYHGKTVAIPGAMPQGEIFRGHSDYYDSDIVVQHIGGDLFLTMGKDPAGRPLAFQLQCFNATDSVFVYMTTGENEVGLSALQLKWEGGVVVRIVDDWLNGVEPGEPGTGLGEIERLR